MIEVLRDESGNITAVCEWLIFNEQGMLDDNGKIGCIAEVEISKGHRGNGLLKKIISNVFLKCSTVEKFFYRREYKYPGRPIKVYVREYVSKKIGG